MNCFSVRSDSKSPFRIHYRLLLLQVILLLILFPSTMASIANSLCSGSCGVGITDDELEPLPTNFESYNDHATSADDHDHEASGNKHHPVSDQHCNCPPVRECPLTLEPKASEQLKENLAPVIRHRLRDLLNKALSVEFATEAAHTIDLLKILNASNSKLDRIRDDIYGAAQTLKMALAKIPEYV